MRIGLRFLFVILLISSLLFSLNSCSDGAGPGESFDRTALLTNYSNNLIIPRYQTLVDQSNALSTAVNDFTAVPNLSNLQALRATFQSSYLAWQACSFFEFGPAADVALRTYLNTFPTDTALINSNISAGGYNLDVPVISMLPASRQWIFYFLVQAIQSRMCFHILINRIQLLVVNI